MLSTHLVTEYKELSALRNEWRRLHSHALSATIFLTWEWVISWVEAVYPTAELFIILVRDSDNNLIAIAPFYRTSFCLLACQHFKTLRCLGDCHAGAEYPDVIVEKGYEEAVMHNIASFLQQNGDIWDWAWFPNIAAWTGAGTRLQSCFCPDNLSFCLQREKHFSSIVLPDSWDEYMGRFSRQRRSTLRRQMKKAEQNCEIQITACDRQKDLDAFLEQLFFLHKRRWQMIGHDGAFVRQPAMVDFYRNMAPRALENGWLALYSLKANGRVVASQYGYIYDGVYNQIQEGFDPDGPAGSGNLLRMHVIRWCIEHNIREYDFLGGHSAHKAHWQAKKRIGYELFLGRNCLKNSLVSKLPFWPTGRYINQGEPAFISKMDFGK
jgi:CelD/BcsL family acetyltransferase involved in cellulose biosynthesis